MAARPDAGHAPQLQLDPQVRVPRRDHPVAAGDHRDPGRPHLAVDRRAPRPGPALRPHPRPVAGALPRPTGAGWRVRSTTPSGGCGSSTSPTARPASASATSVSASWGWPAIRSRGREHADRRRARLDHRRVEWHRRRAGPGARRPGCGGGDQRPQRGEAARGGSRPDARRTGRRHRPGSDRGRCRLGASRVGRPGHRGAQRRHLVPIPRGGVGQRGVRRAPADQPDGHRARARGRRPRDARAGSRPDRRDRVRRRLPRPAGCGGLRLDQGGADPPVRSAARLARAPRHRRADLVPGLRPHADDRPQQLPDAVPHLAGSRGSGDRRRDREGQGGGRLPAADDAGDEDRPSGAGAGVDGGDRRDDPARDGPAGPR